jgi:hypothetical protein
MATPTVNNEVRTKRMTTGPVEAPDPIGQLTQLAALRDSGALTEAEFETQKARLLG